MRAALITELQGLPSAAEVDAPAGPDVVEVVAAPLNPILEWKLKQHIERLLSDDDEPATVTGDATDSLVITADGLHSVPIVLRDYDDPTHVLGLIAVSAREPIELGRGLLGLLGQTLRVLVANSR